MFNLAKNKEIEDLKETIAQMQKDNEDMAKTFSSTVKETQPEVPKAPEVEEQSKEEQKMQPVFFTRQDLDRMIYETHALAVETLRIVTELAKKN